MTTTRRPVRMLVRRRLFMNAKKVAPLNLSASRQNWNLPSRKRTAPKYPTLRRVGACSNGILGFRRNPHLAAGTMLLEMHFVRGPEIHGLVLHQRLEFFYAPSAVQDRLGQCWGAACAAESPTAGTDAGTDALPGQSHTLPQSRPPGSCRPIESQPIPYRGASGEERH